MLTGNVIGREELARCYDAYLLLAKRFHAIIPVGRSASARKLTAQIKPPAADSASSRRSSLFDCRGARMACSWRRSRRRWRFRRRRFAKRLRAMTSLFSLKAAASPFCRAAVPANVYRSRGKTRRSAKIHRRLHASARQPMRRTSIISHTFRRIAELRGAMPRYTRRYLHA